MMSIKRQGKYNLVHQLVVQYMRKIADLAQYWLESFGFGLAPLLVIIQEANDLVPKLRVLAQVPEEPLPRSPHPR